MGNTGNTTEFLGKYYTEIRYYIEITVLQKKLQYFVCSGREHGNIDTWKHEDMETCRHGNMQTWKHADMET
jgi:hypothetical protein